MRLSEAIGTIASMVFAAVILLSFASNPPVYSYWGENLRRLEPLDAARLGQAIGEYIWVNLFPAIMGFLMVILALILGLVSLLRSD